MNLRVGEIRITQKPLTDEGIVGEEYDVSLRADLIESTTAIPWICQYFNQLPVTLY